MASRKNMRSRRNKNSRRNRRVSRRASSRSRQRGGLVLAPAAYNAPSVLLPGGVGSLVQGAQFAQQHLGQHGGAAPIGTTGVLPSGMADAAMQGKLLSALNEIKGMSDMAGGRRRKASKKASRKASKKASRKASKKASRSRKAGKKSRKSRRRSRKASKKANRKSRRRNSKKASRKSRRRQRGGQAPINASYMLGVDAKGTHPQFNDFNQL
jgi:hypothetical protein